jgi:hypothetical protein
MWLGCSNDSGNNNPNPPVIVGDDMADGSGGNGGTGGTGGGGGNGTADMTMVAQDMGPALPDLSGLPPADHDPTQHPAPPRLNAGTGAAVNHNSTIAAPEIWTAVWAGDEQIGDDVQKFTAWMLQSSYWTTADSRHETDEDLSAAARRDHQQQRRHDDRLAVGEREHDHLHRHRSEHHGDGGRAACRLRAV